MYVAGFYSPKEKSGVTEMALSIFHQLKEHTNLSVAFVSNGLLEKEPLNKETIHEFTNLTLNEQKQKINELKSQVDIIIFDASSKLSEEVLKLLPIVNRLFVLGEENVEFTQNLYRTLEFNRLFDKKSKNLIYQVHNRGAYIVTNQSQKVGFSKPLKDINKVCNMIHNDFLNYCLEQNFTEKYNALVKKLKKVSLDALSEESYKLGIEFNKAMLFEKYVQLRVACGQKAEHAIENLLLSILENEYEKLNQQFQNEMNIAQISFKKRTEE